MSGSKNYGTFTQWNTMQQKEGAPTLCNSMDESGEHYAKWNKPGSKRQIPYDLTYKRNVMKKTNEQNRTRGIESWNRLTAVRGEGGGGDWLKEGEGPSQRPCMKDPWTWTTVWGLTIEVGGGLGGEGQRGKHWDNCNSINSIFKTQRQ